MTFRRDYFEEFNKSDCGLIYLATKSSLKPIGNGTIRFKLPNLPYFVLHDVLYIPQLQHNLLSLVLIRQQGYSILLKDAQVFVRKQYNNQILLTRSEDGRLLKLNGNPALSKKIAYLTEEGNLSTTMLWHARLGHICYDKIHIMKKNGVDGLPIFPKCVEKCEACSLAKQHRNSFPIQLEGIDKIIEKITAYPFRYMSALTNNFCGRI